MTFPTNDAFANCELSTSELDAISAGLVITFGPNPPRGGYEHGGGYHHPHQPPRFFPGGSPNDPALHPHH